MPVDEVIETLTGFEEIAIEKQFGNNWQDLAGDAQTMFLRALVFVLLRRDGKNDLEAKQEVMEMTLRECKDRFLDDEEEPNPDEPVTESGKDDTQPA
ncbi:hypothetical protein [Nocardioides antri]|uniref:Uncharacterized protein n=1 Tax=Nocardioides antri TaxID=2607659 RepID=A0A5B1LY28_9ACTN|nr:hypothetical protein [Nocardioides antri]KAA1424310.1 hypothetical protein F0U47_18935 [Nocardioides antri]